MRIYLIIAVLFLIACEKETVDKKTIPAEMNGQWVRGSFDLSEFWNYSGTQLQPAATTDGLDIKGDGTLIQYTVIFPTDPQQGCKPQKLMYRKGFIELNSADSSFIIRYREGRYKEFYQNCTGKENLDYLMPADSLSKTSLAGFYKITESGGKKLFGISYVSTEGPFLYLEKTEF